MKGKKWNLVKHFDGLPKETDIQLVDFDVPAIKNGGHFRSCVSVCGSVYEEYYDNLGGIKHFASAIEKAEILQTSLTKRLFASNLPLGSTFILGEQVAKVVESKNADFPVGTLALIEAGWTSHSVSDGSNLTKIPDLPAAVSVSSTLGAVGMPGFTASYGVFDILRAQPGEVVLVTGAAGAVGNVVGQLAKSIGCTVIGFAGSDAKVKLLKDLGFDVAINYKTMTEDLGETLKAVAPNGIDCFFDNVGGEFANTVIYHMNQKGRIACCGAISQYNSENIKFPSLQLHFTIKELRMEGLQVYSIRSRWHELRKKHIELAEQGKLKIVEHVTDGFDNMFRAFIDLFSGANIGKAIVKA